MKKLFFSCLIGMTMLFPSQISAEIKSDNVVHKKNVTSYVEGGSFIANADKRSGEITDILVHRASDMVTVRTQSCWGYTCSVSLSGLASGNYIVEVETITGSTNFPITI